MADQITSNDKVSDFLIEDYKLKVNYLSNHFSRILTRFNFFLTIQIALFGALGFFLFGEGRSLVATLIPIILGLATSVIWWAVGSQDRRLVVIYRKGIELAAENIDNAFIFKDKDEGLKVWTSENYVGSEKVDSNKGKKFHFDSPISWSWEPISITRMPAIIAVIFFLLWSGSLFMQLYKCSIFNPNWEKSRTVKFKVTSVLDGETIKAESQGNTITVRLVGIDAPEKSKKKNEQGQPFSQKSTKYLESLVLNKSVDIKDYGKDKYGRTLGVVYVDGENVNLEMVKAGLAKVYRGRNVKGLDMEPFWNTEEEAKKAKVGIWSLGNKDLELENEVKQLMNEISLELKSEFEKVIARYNSTL